MWLFWLYESLGFVGVILLIFAYCHFSKKGFWSFLWRNLKWVAWAVVGVWLLIAILCRGDLYNAARCYSVAKVCMQIPNTQSFGVNVKSKQQMAVIYLLIVLVRYQVQKIMTAMIMEFLLII